MKAKHILFAFAAILLIGCSESDESISARVAKARADEAIALFKQDIANLEIQVEKLVKTNEANSRENKRLVQANKTLRQEITRLTKQLEDAKKEVAAKNQKERDAAQAKKQKERDATQARLAWQKVFPRKQWFQGGNLHRATVVQWENASYQNKLATASDWLVATRWKEHLTSPDDFDRLKLKAQMLVNAVDEVIAGQEVDSLRIAEISAALINLSDGFSP